MSTIQITSTVEPFDSPEMARLAVGVISTADAMGLLDDLEIRRLDLPSFREVVDKIASAGIGMDVQAALSAPASQIGRPEMGRLLDRLAVAIEESPSPDHEWGALEDLFGTDRLGQLLGTSPASVRRYRSKARSTPDRLAARLHFLATLVGDLGGAYNDFGVRRWFERPRTALDGRTPAELMQGEWDPEELALQRARDLARSLTASPAT
jgi:hypothetical protein